MSETEITTRIAEPPWSDYERRLLIRHLQAGGLIMRDDSGVGWISANCSEGAFSNELVDDLQVRGFRSGGFPYLLVELPQLPGRWGLSSAPRNLTTGPSEGLTDPPRKNESYETKKRAKTKA